MRTIYEYQSKSGEVKVFERPGDALDKAEGDAINMANSRNRTEDTRFIMMEYTLGEPHSPTDYFGIFEQTRFRGLQEVFWFKVVRRQLHE